MLKNYNDKFKQNMDDALRYRGSSSRIEEERQNKLDMLKRFACTLDLKNEPDDKPETE